MNKMLLKRDPESVQVQLKVLIASADKALEEAKAVLAKIAALSKHTEDRDTLRQVCRIATELQAIRPMKKRLKTLEDDRDFERLRAAKEAQKRAREEKRAKARQEVNYYGETE